MQYNTYVLEELLDGYTSKHIRGCVKSSVLSMSDTIPQSQQLPPPPQSLQVAVIRFVV